ncbi:MAG TPA: Lrp/AsnC family transcriptional regulator [Xanthomonadales bacterium]|nr:Lrp/AsnC family transcriptional regulator [Xanthomonadales bacterium]
MAEEFSRFDLKILEQMQKDCSMSTTDLAEKVGLSQSPCWRRLQRLKEEGYISKQVAILDRSKFGSSLYIFAYLKMATLTDAQRSEFMRNIQVIPEILECHTVFGEMDIVMKIMAQSLEWYQKFIFDTILKLPGVQDIQSTVTLVELKSTTEIPLQGVRVAAQD